jgi:hypothetical protein
MPQRSRRSCSALSTPGPARNGRRSVSPDAGMPRAFQRTAMTRGLLTRLANFVLIQKLEKLVTTLTVYAHVSSRSEKRSCTPGSDRGILSSPAQKAHRPENRQYRPMTGVSWLRRAVLEFLSIALSSAGYHCLPLAGRPIRIGRRRCPHVPGYCSNSPGIGVPQALQLPSGLSRHVVISYQSRPMTRLPQPGQ